MKQTYELSVNDRADESVRMILRSLSCALQSKINGVLEDTDEEYLHDLRVSNRRTRTVLSQMKGVLPPDPIVEFSSNFEWLGIITGPLRDLDVHLLGIDSHRRLSGIDGNLFDTLCQFLEDARQSEHRSVCTALRSPRFQQFVDDWGRFLDSEGEGEVEPPLASAPIIEVAGPRILKAYKRIWKRGAGFTAEAPASLLHRIRIDGKKLRYLLEFFADLYPGLTASRFIKELKKLQDILGEFNDTQVQLGFIEDFVDQDPQRAESSNAVRRLRDIIADRQLELRSDFSERFALFASDESRKLYKKTFKTS